MTDPRRSVRCNRCQKDFAFDQVRMLPTRQAFACKQCLGIVERELDMGRRVQEKLFDFQCLQCRYQFERSLANTPKVCPRCGESGMVKFEKGKLSSKRLLDMADDPRLEKLDRVTF